MVMLQGILTLWLLTADMLPMTTGKHSGVRALLLTAHFSATTLADSGHN